MRWAKHVARRETWGNVRKRDYLQDLGVDGRIVLKYVFKGMRWIDLAQDRDMWLTFVNTVMKIRVS